MLHQLGGEVQSSEVVIVFPQESPYARLQRFGTRREVFYCSSGIGYDANVFMCGVVRGLILSEGVKSLPRFVVQALVDLGVWMVTSVQTPGQGETS